ncbi:hypothetical protein Tco_0340522 [Tanacetum coccineum]
MAAYGWKMRTSPRRLSARRSLIPMQSKQVHIQTDADRCRAQNYTNTEMNENRSGKQQRDPNRGRRRADSGRQQQQTDICRQTDVDSAERSEGR